MCRCHEVMESHKDEGNGEVLCWCEQGRWKFVRQSTEGSSLHTGICSPIASSCEGQTNPTEVFSCRNSSEEQLFQSSGQRCRPPPKKNSWNSQVKSLKSGSSPKGLGKLLDSPSPCQEYELVLGLASCSCKSASSTLPVSLMKGVLVAGEEERVRKEI